MCLCYDYEFWLERFFTEGACPQPSITLTETIKVMLSTSLPQDCMLSLAREDRNLVAHFKAVSSALFNMRLNHVPFFFCTYLKRPHMARFGDIAEIAIKEVWNLWCFTNGNSLFQVFTLLETSMHRLRSTICHL